MKILTIINFEVVFLSTFYLLVCCSAEYLRDIVDLCEHRRGSKIKSQELDDKRTMAYFLLPLSEIVVDFYDELKSLSSGYATFDYENKGYQPSDLVKVR